MRVIRIHHLTVAVRDLDESRQTFASLFGADAADETAIGAFGVRAVVLPLGDGELQLASPTSANSPVSRFLHRRGEGFYNVALEVDDLDAAVEELAARGIRVSEPVVSAPGERSAFIAMAATHGLSIQLVESTVGDAPQPEPEPPAPEEPSPAPRRAHPGEPPPVPRPPLDLTPDEWSDVD